MSQNLFLNIKKYQYLLSGLNVTFYESALSTIYDLNNSRQMWTSAATQLASESKSVNKQQL